MCVYCNMGDTWFRFDPPWKREPQELPYVPAPVQPFMPINPWPLDKLIEYHRLLKEVKEMEDKLGCPCEPNKSDYLGMFEKRIKEMQERLDKLRGLDGDKQ